MCRLDRRSGHPELLRPLVSAVEEVKLQSCSDFSIPSNPWTCGIHWLNDGAVEKAAESCSHRVCQWIFFLDLFCCLGLVELMLQLKFIQRAALPILAWLCFAVLGEVLSSIRSLSVEGISLSFNFAVKNKNDFISWV